MTMLPSRTELRRPPKELLQPKALKDKTLRVLKRLYDKLPPISHDPKANMDKEGQFFPACQERDFGAYLFHELAVFEPRLVVPFGPSGTSILHMEMGYGWTTQIHSLNKQGLLKEYKKSKMDIAFIDPNVEIEWFQENREAVGDLTILGAIELKRNFYQDWNKIEEDLKALRVIVEKSDVKCFGLFVIPYAFPYSDDPKMKRQKLKITRLYEYLDGLPKIDLDFVSFDYLRGIAMKHPFQPRDAELGYVDVIDALRNWT